MKRTVFLSLILLLTAASVSARQYRPLLKDGKVWNIRYNVVNLDSAIQWTLFIEGDTIIDGERWQRMRQIWGGELSQGAYLLQEEEGRVWQYTYLNSEKKYGRQLLYDFNLEEGDSVGVHSCEDMVVSSVDTVMTQGHAFMRITMSESVDQYPGQYTLYQKWIEGVGGESGPLLSRSSRYSGSVKITLLSCYEDGECIFMTDGFDLAPWKTSGIVSPIDRGRGSSCQFYDLLGRRLLGRPAKGVYIKDGRKYVAE